MLKKTITYENPFTGMKQTEEFYFHFSKADLVRMEVEEHKEHFVAKDGTEYTGMQAKLQRIVEAEDGKAMMPVFEDIIHRSYGRKDGDRFIRTEEIWLDFKGSGAFDELLFQLCTDAEASAEFMNGTMPGNLEQIAAEIQSEASAVTASKKAAAKRRPAKKAAAGQSELEDSGRQKEIEQATAENPVELTQEELTSLNATELQAGLAEGKFKFPGTYAL